MHKGVGVFVPDGHCLKSDEAKSEEEINFAQTLNRVLPAEIRVLAWTPVEEGFSARFNCTQRVYKYFFPKGNLDIEVSR